MQRQKLTTEALIDFATVARHLNFTRAAEQRGVHRSVFSRRIQALERQLGVRLLDRDTRRVTLTNAGALLLEHAVEILSRIDDAETAVTAQASEPTGVLRLAVPNLFGQLHVAPLIPALLKRYPGFRLEINFTDHFLDLAESGFDAAVRIGALEAGGDLKVRKLTRNRRVLCASPDYLAREGRPQTPADLIHHRTLHFTPTLGGTTWPLTGSGGAIEIAVDPVLAADNIEGLRLAALAGAGITILATFVAGADLEAGRLVRVFDDFYPAESTISVVYRNAPYLPRRVRVLVDFLIEAFAGIPPWETATDAP